METSIYRIHFLPSNNRSSDAGSSNKPLCFWLVILREKVVLLDKHGGLTVCLSPNVCVCVCMRICRTVGAPARSRRFS